MRHIKEFSRFADVYTRYHTIQKQVAKELVECLKSEPQHLIDLGCGSGTLYKELFYKPKSYVGVDLSDEMLEHHPKADNIKLLCRSFDELELFKTLSDTKFDMLISSSALQWSKDLAKLFERIVKLDKPFAITLFTDNTFKTLHKEAGTRSPLHSKEMIADLAKKYFNRDVEFREYILKFENNRELFKYLKKSGVSGNEVQLNYPETKRLLRQYPLDYLEFEVAFIIKESA